MGFEWLFINVGWIVFFVATFFGQFCHYFLWSFFHSIPICLMCFSFSLFLPCIICLVCHPMLSLLGSFLFLFSQLPILFLFIVIILVVHIFYYLSRLQHEFCVRFSWVWDFIGDQYAMVYFILSYHFIASQWFSTIKVGVLTITSTNMFLPTTENLYFST